MIDEKIFLFLKTTCIATWSLRSLMKMTERKKKSPHVLTMVGGKVSKRNSKDWKLSTKLSLRSFNKNKSNILIHTYWMDCELRRRKSESRIGIEAIFLAIKESHSTFTHTLCCCCCVKLKINLTNDSTQIDFFHFPLLSFHFIFFFCFFFSLKLELNWILVCLVFFSSFIFFFFVNKGWLWLWLTIVDCAEECSDFELELSYMFFLLFSLNRKLGR